MEYKNSNLNTHKDYLYHLDINLNDDVREEYKDIKFVCCGGKASRMENFAKFLYEKLQHPQNSIFEEDGQLKNISASAGRYSMFKVGPCISISHGMGMASLSILLHEIFKLLAFAGCKNVRFIRIGTSGGLGLKPGTTVITKQPYSGLLQPFFTQIALGKEIRYESKFDEELSSELFETSKILKISALIGNTMSCNDFYEEQGRVDGALCSFTLEDKMAFLKKAHDEYGVKNIEMESNILGSMCRRMGIKCATVCVTLLDRLIGDEVLSTKEDIKKWENFPQQIVGELIYRQSLK